MISHSYSVDPYEFTQTSWTHRTFRLVLLVEPFPRRQALHDSPRLDTRFGFVWWGDTMKKSPISGQVSWRKPGKFPFKFPSKFHGTSTQFKLRTPIKNPRLKPQPFVLVATEGVQLWHLPGQSSFEALHGGYLNSWMLFLMEKHIEINMDFLNGLKLFLKHVQLFLMGFLMNMI